MINKLFAYLQLIFELEIQGMKILWAFLTFDLNSLK
jgi:hypothetical protein